MITSTFLKVAQEGHFFDKHQKVLLAISGGKDSMNLLELLYVNREILGIEIGLAHVNHKQRIESDEEELYLKQLAQERGLAFYSTNFSGTFSETKARKFRYHFFENIMREHSYTALLTAHHYDDQVETIFMKIIRGTRLRHLAGIKVKQPFAQGELIRPLLTFSKSDLQDCFYFEDKSNESSVYMRNRIRNTYLPLLHNENPKFDRALLAFSNETQVLFQAFLDLTMDIDKQNISEFRKQTPSVQYFLLQNYLEQFPDLQLSKEQFEDVLHIILKKANYYHQLKNGYFLKKDYERFKITKIRPQTDTISESFMIESRGIFNTKYATYSLNLPLEGADQVIYLQKNLPITIRPRQVGDSMIINGIHKKIRRLFIDLKIPKEQRKNSLLIEQEGEIYGITNIVASDLSKSLKDDIIKDTLYIKMKE